MSSRPSARYIITSSLLILVCLLLAAGRLQAQADTSHAVVAGDTWRALALRYGVTQEALQAANAHPNRWREPVIGRSVIIPPASVRGKSGRLINDDRSLYQLSAESGIPAWRLALLNGMSGPSDIRPQGSIFIPGEATVREYPVGFLGLELSHVPAKAGEAMGVRGAVDGSLTAGDVMIGDTDGSLFVSNSTSHAVGLLATGAFFWEGGPHLDIVSVTRLQKPACINPSAPNCEVTSLWSQPLAFEKKVWTFNNITLTGAAAQIDADSIAAERARLFELWKLQSADFLPNGPFGEPVSGYLYHSSFYGARRSYNGGPYASYHEGLDFAAYRGSNVSAPAAGTVILAETLYVRGGAVIIDHGLGIYTGVYHLDSVEVTAGMRVEEGTLVGTVGSTGLSTGPHLHWDLLVNGVWVDPFAWRASAFDCWLLEALKQGCETGS